MKKGENQTKKIVNEFGETLEDLIEFYNTCNEYLNEIKNPDEIIPLELLELDEDF